MMLPIKSLLKHSPIILCIILCIIYCISRGFNNFVTSEILFAVFLVTILVLHLVFDYEYNLWFTCIISLFLISGLIKIKNFYSRDEFLGYVTYIIWIISFFVILIKMLINHSYKFHLSKYLLLTTVVIGINIWTANELISLSQAYSKNGFHVMYFSIFTIIKIVILSIGIIFYSTNNIKEKDIATLNLALLCFLLADIIDIMGSLFFNFKFIPILSVLKGFLLCCGVFLLYLYYVGSAVDYEIDKKD